MAKGDARRSRRERRGDGGNGRGPRAPRAEHSAATIAAEENANTSPNGDGSDEETAVELAAAAIVLTGSAKRASRTARRARAKQRESAAAVELVAGDDPNNPALGALNRHLNMMMQQLATAHRVIGRVAAERDALRQQLADFQGIPIEEIVVTTIGASSDRSSKRLLSSETKSTVSRLNYFGGDDVALMRKRRQTLVLGILVVVAVILVTARMGVWTMPGRISRESLTQIPYIGDIMALFLVGWMFFRLIRVSSKGVKWVFPSENQKRRGR